MLIAGITRVLFCEHHVSDNPFRCSICQAEFTNEEDLAEHNENQHAGEFSQDHAGEELEELEPQDDVSAETIDRSDDAAARPDSASPERGGVKRSNHPF